MKHIKVAYTYLPSGDLLLMILEQTHTEEGFGRGRPYSFGHEGYSITSQANPEWDSEDRRFLLKGMRLYVRGALSDRDHTWVKVPREHASGVLAALRAYNAEFADHVADPAGQPQAGVIG